ncbi:hypothetical protein TNCT_34741 [Trichonephila clavata]|uniref:Uncharacterized protein n=1 Tax=Trichonephila clavata TaxID=2740835 RepID=A0A8X6GDX0_TRICU|nr:hypothetical protein TNCT_34741 [Trichonephila clavata]
MDPSSSFKLSKSVSCLLLDPHPSETAKTLQQQAFDYSPQSHIAYLSSQPTNVTMEDIFCANHENSLGKETGIQNHQTGVTSKTTGVEAENHCHSFSASTQYEISKSRCDLHPNHYVTTLKVPLRGNGGTANHIQNDSQSVRTEIILESGKWKPVTIRPPEHDSESSEASYYL